MRIHRCFVLSSCFSCLNRNGLSVLHESQRNVSKLSPSSISQGSSSALAPPSNALLQILSAFVTNVKQCHSQVSSLGYFNTLPIRCFSSVQQALREVAEPLPQVGQGNFKGRASLKRALCIALQNYLVAEKGVASTEAAFIVKNAPGFMKKLIARAKEESSLIPYFAPSKPQRMSNPDHEGLLKFENEVYLFLEKENINEMEVYFETLGLSHFSVLKDVVSLEKPKLAGEEGLLASTELLQSLGVPRKRIWRIFERDRKLLSCTHADLNSSLHVLESLGVQKKALPALIQACPSVLRIDLEETMKEVLTYMDDLGIEKNFVGRLLQYNPQEVLQAKNSQFGEKMQVLLDCGLSKDRVIRILREFPQLLILSLDHHIKPNIEFLCSLSLTKEQVGKVIVGSPQILSYSVKRNLLPKIAYLESLGVAQKVMGSILVKFPGVFGHSIEESMAPKVKFLETFGVQRKSIGRIITIFPAIWGYSIDENLLPKMKFFESIGIERASLGRVITRSPSILGLSVEQNLKPKVAFFEQNGVKGKDIARLFMSHPSAVGRAIDGSLSSLVEFLTSLGIEPKSSAMARALVACAAISVTSLETKVNILLQMGLAQEAVLKIVIQQPTLMHLSEEYILSKMKYYTEEVGLSIHEVAKSPPLLSYSLEKRIKPRYKLISWLSSHGLLPREYLMITIMSMSERSFVSKFVDPHPQKSAEYSGAFPLPGLGVELHSVSSDALICRNDYDLVNLL